MRTPFHRTLRNVASLIYIYIFIEKGKNKKGEKPSKENGKDKTEEDKEDKEDNKEKDEDATKIEPIDNGSPSLLMITCGAIRATDLIRLSRVRE